MNRHIQRIRAIALLALVFISAFATAGRAACTPSPSGLVAWWPGEGNANDVIGGNNGTLINGTSFAPGEVGNAFDFNGINNYILVNTMPDLNVGTGEGLTFEGWIYLTTLDHEQLIFEFESNLGTFNGNDTGINCAVHPDRPGALYSNLVGTDRTSHELISPLNEIVPNVWQHIAITYDKASGMAALYLNGVPITVANFGSFTPETSLSHLVMGARTTFNSVSNPGDAVSGMMDELSFYSRALSPAEIMAIYNAGSAGKCPPGPVAPAITSQPVSETVTVGGTAIFSVTATGTAPLSYQWYFDNLPLPGATNSTLVLPNAQVAKGIGPIQSWNQHLNNPSSAGPGKNSYLNEGRAGNYWVMISNAAGSTNSATAALTVLKSTASGCTPPPAGIAAWWPGEGNVNDIIGGNNGTFVNGAGFTNGEVGQAFNFNGINNYILVNATPTLNVGAGSGLTFEGWVYLNTLDHEQLIFEYEGNLGTFNGDDTGINFSFHPDKPGALYSNLEGTDRTPHELLSPFNIFVPNAWQHIAVTYDKASGAAALYLNGSPVVVTNLGSFTPETSLSHLVMGARTTFNSVSNPGDAVSGMMDELTFYSRALSPAEIAAIYNAGSAGKCVPLPVATNPKNVSSPASTASVISSQPTLMLTGSGKNLQLSWPAGSGSLQVQAADSPIGPWTTIILPIITNGANATIMVPSTNQQQFFRLQGQ